MPSARFRRRAALLALCAGLGGTSAAAQGRGSTPTADGMRFHFMGPAVGNRISAAAGIPGDATTYYAGAASGGVWKSTDGGQQWSPIFDRQPVQAIGALAVANSDHNLVWAGTGEAWAIRDVDMMGDGVYKSTDAGRTWQHMGLDETGRIGRIVIHPTMADTVYICAAGRLTGPQRERGVFKTTDGGRTWQQSLFADANTGCSGLAMDPADSNTLFAGMWQVEMHTYGMFSGGPASALYVSHDAGAHWRKLEGHGLPHAPLGKIDVAIAPTNSKRVYALIQTADQGSLWRSDDGGENWTNGSWQRELIGRAGYYIRLAVSPTNADEVFVANSDFWGSTDGGKTFRALPWGGDTHDIWIDPKDGSRILVTHDGGLYMTSTHGRTARHVTLPIGQMYHVAVDNDVPYKIYSNMQDGSTMRGPSNVPEAGPNVPAAPGAGAWEHRLGGCESGFTLPDLTDTNIIWATCYGGEVTRYDARGKLARSVSPWFHTLDSEPGSAKYRCHWTAPLAIDPFDHNRVYLGCQMILRTTNGGMNWTEISPDLSTRDASRLVSSGGIVGDNLGQFYGEVVFAIAPSEIQRDLIWAGTNDGKLWYTRDAGRNWVDVTGNIAGLPAWGEISKIEPSHFDPASAYIAVDFHLMDNREPWLYKTEDWGKTWTKISSGLPRGHPLDYARVIAENPNKRDMLFAGTGHALYYSLDDGRTWTLLNTGLPAAPISWVVVEKQAHDLVVSTYGRGIYTLEDITPLEEGLMEPGYTVPVTLVEPRTAYRRAGGLERALLSYQLAVAPKAPVQIEILDARGVSIDKLPPAAAHAGLNRVAWNMHLPPPRLVALRTTPPENPHIWEEPRFQHQDTRPVTHWGIQPAETGPVVAPGRYTVKLTVDGQSFTQPFSILLPPDSHGKDADIQAAVRLQTKVRDDISTVADMVNQIEWMRRQLEDQRKTAAGKDALLRAMEEMDRKMQGVEFQMITRANALSDDKYFQTADKIYMKLIWLSGEIGSGAGDVAGAADYGPTETEQSLVVELESQIQAVEAQYNTLIEQAVPAYNKSVAASGLNPLKTTGAPPPPSRPNGLR